MSTAIMPGVATDDYGTHGARDTDVATVQAIYAAFAARDLDGMLAHVADDVEVVPVGTARRIGRTDPYRGHAGLREYFADAEELWDELTLHPEDVRATIDSVVVFGFVDARVGGRTIRRRVVWTWKLRGGKVAVLRVHDVGGDPYE
jgi:ketosteroid isomerase-like protein